MGLRRLDKKAFFADVNYTPHVGQWRVHNSQASRRVLACGVRWGKSLCAAMESLAAALEPCERSVGWCCAPTYSLADKVFREIVVIIGNHLKHRLISTREHEKRIVIRNMGGGESEICAKSADNPVSLLGEGLNWLVVDEASRLRPMIWNSYLSQRLMDKKGWALFISTPAGKNYFYDLFRRGKSGDPDYESWNSPSWENPHLDRLMIEKERERIPQRVFSQEYEAEFLEGYGSVFHNVRDCATGKFAGPILNESYLGGLDLAKVEDFTVLTLLNRNRELVYVDRFHKIGWDLQITRIRGASDNYNRARILCDSTGAGEPIFDNLRASQCNVKAYPFTAQSKQDLINNLALMFEKKQITLPTPELWPDGIEELESYEYDVSDSGAVRMGAPSGQHDDCVISLSLAAWLAKIRQPPIVLIA
ncbi:MAG: hypothetical protein HY286_06990 [Planctomycetes bacterium]|nr:hypothetical protein [Planctomycetota bacterium]